MKKMRANKTQIFLFIGMLIYTLYSISTGKRGLFALREINKTISQKHEIMNVLEKKKEKFERKIRLIKKEKEADIIDELIRSNNGYIDPHEIVIFTE